MVYATRPLVRICATQDARLEAQGRDRYGRTIATVYCAGRNANAELAGRCRERRRAERARSTACHACW